MHAKWLFLVPSSWLPGETLPIPPTAGLPQSGQAAEAHVDLAASHLSQEQICQAKKLDYLLLGPHLGFVKGVSEVFGARTPRGPHRIFASCNCKEGSLDQRRLDRGA